ncbi:hypothetical protein E2C01_099499 [Portunus trituberculatus]|uniref:Uncharacterized protein n=1 Tax=Portunus trituberculatus TaxID=210409 RepID=A0A5B7KAX3_PORTR|nr:hypothetical protein [Portunus trituberculatus]
MSFCSVPGVRDYAGEGRWLKESGSHFSGIKIRLPSVDCRCSEADTHLQASYTLSPTKHWISKTFNVM